MSRFFKKYKILFLILVIAAILRLWNLAGNPPSLTSDEAALGYNAYSILKTGRDEYGQFLPIIFKSFGDWKPGFYIYTDVPFVAIFGLNEWSLRLPGAISGIIAVWLIYLAVGELFRSKNFQFSIFNFQLLAALLLAISPWHIHFSRGAWEANLALTLTLAGIYFFLRAIRDRSSWFIYAAIFFGLTLITYQGAKMSTGFVVLGLALLWFKKILDIPRKVLIMGLIIGTLAAMPAIMTLFNGKAGRLEVFSVFSYPRPPEYTQAILDQGDEKKGDLIYFLFHSEPFNFARGILGRWMNHYSTRFLFFEGDWVHHNLGVPNAGVLLFMDIFLLIAGMIFLIRMKANPQTLFVWYWLLVSPLPSALSRDTVHAIRAFNEVIPLTIILACGAFFIISKWKKIIISLFIPFYLANFIYFFDQYFIHAPIHNAKYWEYGYKEMVEKISRVQKNYQQIVVAQSYEQPYIYFLFYQKYDPATYQKQSKLVEGAAGKLDVGFIEKLDNIQFAWPDWSRDRGKKGVLFVGNTEQIPPADSRDSTKFKVDQIKYPNGSIAFRLVEVL
ncbi:glycosyltransferase family 39 protein [Candidatus Microgenomates bacterium]|nr:glycosyltransferase family 39 protein [Candidatus Microgenomates bacterium]